MIKLKVQKSPKHDLNVLPLASSANRKKNGHMTVSFFFFFYLGAYAHWRN